ncbi:hypothetical protein PAE9249_02911 [Paenibacillus sp. CECT 9249]|uniref:RNA polymerase sigma factor n=1 Tax=Paenibacillus sp. CECT 9249 TaxID=2845385 RepID=UPI001E2FB0F7|nr:RNA polymerase sigma factor [Paenibacillus sp. CECT 9249]CAH0120392.1 hypothetical protein PAE9249_02911 [Paenibacillus sp. CECT 9249]
MEQHTEADLQNLEQEAWNLKKRFLETVAPYRSDLWRYCRKLTGSPWDAEDLVQETLLKALASLGQIWQPVFPKSYLFRIATNTWINQCRRDNRFELSSYDEEWDDSNRSGHISDFEVYESIELLVHRLSPKQAAAILLAEVFHFTAKETADMLATTEGAMKSLLHRARKNLRSMQTNDEKNRESRSVLEREYPMPDRKVIDSIIDAFHKRDPEAMAALFSEYAYNDIVHVGQEFGRETIKKYSVRDTFLHWSGALKAFFRMLWDRPVVIVLIDTNQGWQLKSVIYLETLDCSIVYKKEYYFCEDLLLEAAKELDVKLHERGW